MGRFHQGPPTKNPGALAGATGVDIGSASRAEQQKTYNQSVPTSRLRLRSIFNDDGHFQGLEVPHV
jgi:hypothetical protein